MSQFNHEKMSVADDNVRRQAAHFDEKEPISPWPEVLRLEGFRYHYIAKDLVIKRALDDSGINKGSRVLDIGCGTGVWLDRLASSYGIVGTGVDVSSRSLTKARSSSVRQNTFVLADARALPFPNDLFELIVSLDVLEHIEIPENALKEMGRVARPNASILAYAVSKRNTYTFQWFERKLLAALGINPHPLAGHDPDLFIDPKLVENALDGQDMNLEKIEYFHAFFTSIFDRILLVIYGLSKKLGLLRVRNDAHRKIAVAYLTWTSLISRLALSALLWLDGPWLSRGYANGFLVIARKKPIEEGEAPMTAPLEGMQGEQADIGFREHLLNEA